MPVADATIDADFHVTAMVATAPGEKLLRAPPCEELDPPYDIKLAFVQKTTFVLRKINKNCCHQSCPFDSNMHQIVCRLGLRPRPHWLSLQRFSRPPSCI